MTWHLCVLKNKSILYGHIVTKDTFWQFSFDIRVVCKEGGSLMSGIIIAWTTKEGVKKRDTNFSSLENAIFKHLPTKCGKHLPKDKSFHAKNLSFNGLFLVWFCNRRKNSFFMANKSGACYWKEAVIAATLGRNFTRDTERKVTWGWKMPTSTSCSDFFLQGF